MLVPSGSTAVMARRVEPPDSLDYFPTPPWATRALFVHVLPQINPGPISAIWEPACGEGHMAEVMREPTVGAVVTATDIFDYGYGKGGVDFLGATRPRGDFWVVTNPPFKPAVDFALKALDLAVGVAMLCRTQWLEGRSRYERLFRDRPPTLFAPFVERVPMVKGRWDPDASTATSYAWFVWMRRSAFCGGGWTDPRAPFWIPPGCRNRLTMECDRARFAPWSLAPAAAPLLDGAAA